MHSCPTLLLLDIELDRQKQQKQQSMHEDAAQHKAATGSSRCINQLGLTTSSILFLRPSVSFMTFRDSSRRSSYTLVPPISFSRSSRSLSFIVVMAMIWIAQAQHQ